MGDFNLALVIVAIVVCVLVFIFNLYLLVNYQHPDDVNQAYFPKFVIVLGLSVAAISILMLPADVANRQACRHVIYNGACNLTLPMKELWIAVYIIDAILVFFVIPFAMFYYEGDQDKSVWKRMKSTLIWVAVTAVVCALLLGILYGYKTSEVMTNIFKDGLDAGGYTWKAVSQATKDFYWREFQGFLLVIYIIAQQPAYGGLGATSQLTPLQLETLLAEGNTSKFWMVEFRSLSTSSCIRASSFFPDLSITFSNTKLSFGTIDLGLFPNAAEKFGISLGRKRKGLGDPRVNWNTFGGKSSDFCPLGCFWNVRLLPNWFA